MNILQTNWMKKAVWAGVLSNIFFLSVSCSCLVCEPQLTEEGRTKYRIVLPADASNNLKYAAYELKLHLDEASGATFEITQDSSADAKKQIVLREKDPELSPGEFRIKTEGKKLLLSGGGESGIHHAVHDFLETDCGYIWYDARGGKKVPDLKNFKLPEIDRRKSYPFLLRSMTSDYFFHHPESHYFLYRNGMNSKIRLFPLPGMDKNSLHFSKAGRLIGSGVDDLRFAIPSAHTVFDYIPDAPQKSRIKEFKSKGYFQEHPEYFTLSETGTRVTGRQLCFSDPNLRAEFKKNFREHIRLNPGANVFSVTAYDFPGAFCFCEACQASVEKYRTPGAPIFLFVKELAEEIQKEFPDIRIITYAYRKEQTEFPPEGLDFPDNVILCFCPIDDDMVRDWNSESNAETFRNLKEWKNHCRNLFLFYYVNPWTLGTLTTPAVGNVHRCAVDTVLAWKAGVNGCLYSHPVGVPSMTGFTELQSYLMARLMRDPELDIDSLIEGFMAFEYGKAAPLMRKYLNELESVAENTGVFVKWNAVAGVWNTFLKSQDVVRWQGYFDRMEKLVSDVPDILFSVQRVRVPLNIMTLRFLRRIQKEVPEYKTNVQTLAGRIKRVYHRATQSFYTQSVPQIKRHMENHDRALDRLVDNLTVQEGADPKPLPDEIFGTTDPALVFEFFPESMEKSVLADDAQAAWGKTLVNTGEAQGYPIQNLKYDAPAKVWDDVGEILEAKPGTEGKYCFYHVGTTSISPSYELRIHLKDYKNLFRIFPGEVWMPGTDDTIDIYVSLKLTGPRYYPGSQEKDSIACDRIVIVRKTNN